MPLDPNEMVNIDAAKAHELLIKSTKRHLRDTWVWIQTIAVNAGKHDASNHTLKNQVGALVQLRAIAWALDDLLNSLGSKCLLMRCSCVNCVARFEVQRDRQQELDKEAAVDQG